MTLWQAQIQHLVSRTAEPPPRTYHRQCRICRRYFKATFSTAMYCGEECKKDAARHRANVQRLHKIKERNETSCA